MTPLRIGAGLLLGVCLASAQFGWVHRPNRSGGKRAPHADDDIVGLVLKVTPEAFVVRAVDTRVVTFRLTESTLFFHGVKWESPAQLRRGAVVLVEATGDKDGILTATAVVFRDEKPRWQMRATAEQLLPKGVKDDPLVGRARAASETFFRILPNFLCQQSTSRFYSGPDKRWRQLDQITAEVLYEKGHELYREVKLNGRSTGRSMMDLPGSKSSGEFGSTLRALFDSSTEALFQFEANATVSGFATAMYSYAISGDHSDWRITAGSQTIGASQLGKIWIDRKSGYVVRIEMTAVDIPEAFPFRRVEATVDYGPVLLSSARYFLPVRAENLSCQEPQKSCSKNVIEWRNYHKYVGESSISFDTPNPDPAPQ